MSLLGTDSARKIAHKGFTRAQMAVWWDSRENVKEPVMTEHMRVREVRAQARAQARVNRAVAVAPVLVSVSPSVAPKAKTPINKTGQPRFKAASSAKKKEMEKQKQKQKQKAGVSRTGTSPRAERARSLPLPTPLPRPLLRSSLTGAIGRWYSTTRSS